MRRFLMEAPHFASTRDAIRPGEQSDAAVRPAAPGDGDVQQSGLGTYSNGGLDAPLQPPPPPGRPVAATASSTALVVLPAPNTTLATLAERPSWLTVQEGYDFCSLCRLYATDGHLQSKKHRAQVEWHSWYEEHPESEEDNEEAYGNPAHFERRGHWMWCLLCNQWAVHGHLKGQKHQKRLEWESWSGEPSQPALPALPSPLVPEELPALHDAPSTGTAQSSSISDAIVPVETTPSSNASPGTVGLPWGADPAHFEWRDGWWWCLLCEQWFGKGHIAGRRHQKRLTWADWKDDDTESTGIPSNAITCSDREDGPLDAVQEAIEDASDDPWGAAWSRAVANGYNAHSQSHSSTSDASTAPSRGGATAPSSSPQGGATASSSSSQGGATPSSSSSSGWNYWKSAYSERHQRVYYYNTATGERSWQQPAALARLSAPSSSQSQQAAAGSQTQSADSALSSRYTDKAETKRTLQTTHSTATSRANPHTGTASSASADAASAGAVQRTDSSAAVGAQEWLGKLPC